jgi:hypothetical protein
MRRVLALGLVVAVALVVGARRRRAAHAPAVSASAGSEARVGDGRTSRPAAGEVVNEAAHDAPAPAHDAAPSHFVSVPWVALGAPGNGAELLIRYHATAQMELDRVDVQETDTQVFVTVLMRAEAPSGGRLADEIEAGASARLRRPLGDRELVHAPLDWSGSPSRRQQDHPAA